MKIVSLVPSITELLADLGLEEELKGITKFCTHPQHYRQSKTIVGGTKNVHLDRIRSIGPDLIIANREENTKEQVEALQEEFRVYLTDVNSLDDALDMIRETGKLTDREMAAESLAAKIDLEFAALAKSIKPGSRKKVAYLIWKDPLMVAGGNTYINDMMLRCGLENVFQHINRYPVVTMADLQNFNTELVFLSSEPYPFRQQHIESLAPGLPGIQLKLVDGEMFSWYGSRMLKAAQYFDQLSATI